VWLRSKKKWIGHAWVEWDGQVFDSGQPDGVLLEDYYQMARAKPIKRFNRLQAAKAMFKSQHMGPWY
jgi:hypothetical protein